MDEGKPLFSDIKFIIAQCNNADHVKTILLEEGAKLINYLSEHVTLVIADNNCPEAEEAIELFDKPVVSSLWVHLSIKAKKLLPTEAFSPIKNMLLNHVIASFSSDLSKNDVDILASTLTFYGARVSKDIASSTHFIVAKADPSDLPDKSDLNGQFKIVTPDWVQESVRLSRCCNEQFFDPALLLPPLPPEPTPHPQAPVLSQKDAASEAARGSQTIDTGGATQPNAPSTNNEHKTNLISIERPGWQPRKLNQGPNITLGENNMMLFRTTSNIIGNVRPQFQQNFSTPGPYVQQNRAARSLFVNQESRTFNSTPPIGYSQTGQLVKVPRMPGNGPRMPGQNPRMPGQAPRVPGQNPRMPSNSQSQPQPRPHPSIFDHRQESSLAQIKAKVPRVSEDIEYFGVSPKHCVPKNFPFTGCKFKIDQYENIDPKQRQKWCNSIKAAGGMFVEDLKETSFLICEDRLSSLYSEALTLGVRCVTIYWINDVLGQDKLTYPWRALHLPVSFSKSNKPLTNHIVTTTNLTKKDRRNIREILFTAGAKYTEYFSQSNTLVICGNVGGEKYERSLTLKIPIANCQLLSDVLLQTNVNLNAMLAQSKYQLFNSTDPLKMTSYSEVRDLMSPWTVPITINDKLDTGMKSQVNGNSTLVQNSGDLNGSTAEGNVSSDLNVVDKGPNLVDGHFSTKCQQATIENAKNSEQSGASNQLTLPNPNSNSIETKLNHADGSDKQVHCDKVSDYNPMMVDNEIISSLLTDVSTFASKVPAEDEIGLDFKSATDVVTASQDDNKVAQSTRSVRKSKAPIRILFTHLDRRLTEQLISYAEKLELGFATAPTNCTHLIVDRISRTTKFICAINHAEYILSYKWIIESHEANKLLDEKHFFLEDKSGEEEFSVNLVHSLYKRKKRAGALFNNFVFFVTPSVRPKGLNMKEMIESAGGVMTTKKFPTNPQIQQLVSDKKRFVVIACNEDFHLCLTIDASVVDIVDIEFVISGILRQDIDFHAHRLRITTEGFVRPGRPCSPSVSLDPSPPKKLRRHVPSC